MCRSSVKVIWLNKNLPRSCQLCSSFDIILASAECWCFHEYILTTHCLMATLPQCSTSSKNRCAWRSKSWCSDQGSFWFTEPKPWLLWLCSFRSNIKCNFISPHTISLIGRGKPGIITEIMVPQGCEAERRSHTLHRSRARSPREWHPQSRV